MGRKGGLRPFSKTPDPFRLHERWPASKRRQGKYHYRFAPRDNEKDKVVGCARFMLHGRECNRIFKLSTMRGVHAPPAKWTIFEKKGLETR